MNLKTIGGDWNTKQFAYLIVPTDPVKNDAELYAAVHKHGRAVIREFANGTLELGSAKALTPTEFESKWQGD